MKKSFRNSLSILAIIILQSCAHQAETVREVEKEIKETPKISQEDVIDAARVYIEKAPNLTISQKEKLLKIEDRVMLETTKMKDEINKMQIVLIKAAFEPIFEAREVEILKRKILALERKKIRVGLNAFIEARNLIDPVQINNNKALNKTFINRFNPPM